MNINRAKNGHVKLWIKINDSDIAQDNNAYLVFVKMLFFAHYGDEFTSIRFNGKQYKLKAGEFSASMAELSVLVNLPISTLRKVIDRLVEDKRISKRTDRQTTVFSICNWSLYQGDQRKRLANERANDVANEVANDVANDVANVTEGKKKLKKLKNIKNIDTNVSMAKTPRTDIDEMFQVWEDHTGMQIIGQVTKNRFACSNLLKKHGKEKLTQLIKGVALAQADQYAPRISDFSALQSKQNDLIAWGKTKQTSNQSKVVTV